MQDDYKVLKQKLKDALAQVVKRHRKMQNKSISQISAEIMMTKSMWQTLEKGKKDPQYSTLWRVAEALGVSVEEISSEVSEILGKDFSITEILN